jgi:hypothetical protein
LLAELDARLRGHDRKNSPTAQSDNKIKTETVLAFIAGILIGSAVADCLTD